MRHFIRSASVTIAALGAAVALAGCNDFLTGGELSNDPNRPSAVTVPQLYRGVASNIAAIVGSDPARLAGLFVGQYGGGTAQYLALTQSLSINESTTNGFYTTLYSGGGLIDARREQDLARQAADSGYLGAAQVQEAIIAGTGADIFGDIVYSQAYGQANPALDPQLQVYDAVQTLLSSAITNLSRTGATNTAAPGGVTRAQWIATAHTLKARYYLHTAEVRPTAYAQALAEAKQGLTDPDNDFVQTFSGNAGEQAFPYQFETNRPGQILPGPVLDSILAVRNDPRRAAYFNSTQSGFSDAFLAADATQTIVGATENLLIEAEAAYRTGDPVTAITALNAEQTIQGVPLTPIGTTGTTLLKAILEEKYIALFNTIEPWNDYKRTCYPNIKPPTTAQGRKIPARLLYDTNERQTNTNIPAAQNQPTRNANDPVTATDPFGNACLGQ